MFFICLSNCLYFILYFTNNASNIHVIEEANQTTTKSQRKNTHIQRTYWLIRGCEILNIPYYTPPFYHFSLTRFFHIVRIAYIKLCYYQYNHYDSASSSFVVICMIIINIIFMQAVQRTNIHRLEFIQNLKYHLSIESGRGKKCI